MADIDEAAQRYDVRVHTAGGSNQRWETVYAREPEDAARRAVERLMLPASYEAIAIVDTSDGKRIASRMFRFRAVVALELVEETRMAESL